MKIIYSFVIFGFLTIFQESKSQEVELVQTNINSYIEQNNLEIGLQKVDDAIKKHPEESIMYFYKAILFSNQKKWVEAIENINRAIEKAPDHEKYYFIKSIIYASQNNYETALVEIENALAILPNYKEFVIYKFSYLLHQKKYDQAYQLIKSLDECYPKDAYIQGSLALITHLLHKKESSLEHIQRAFSSNNSSPFVNTLYGQIKLQLGDTIGAINHFHKTMFSQDYELGNYINNAGVYLSKNQMLPFWEEMNRMIQKSKSIDLVKKYKNTLNIYPDPFLQLGTEQLFCALFRPWRSNGTEIIYFLNRNKDSFTEVQKTFIPLYEVYISLFSGNEKTTEWIENLQKMPDSSTNKGYSEFLIRYYFDTKFNACKEHAITSNDSEGFNTMIHFCK